MTMLKTVSAALLAVSVIAAPALAANPGKTAQPPTAKTAQPPTAETGAKTAAKTAAQAPAIKGGEVKTGALNANAKMNHQHHYRYHHHKKITALKSHTKPGFKNAAKGPTTKTPVIKKTHAAKVETNKVQANKSHSKVSFKHASFTAKRG
jgi:hypothetical protein